MFEERKGFGSDNHSGVHPAIMQSIIDVNHGHLPSYGTDEVCLMAQEAFDKIFNRKTKVFFVFNGTAANTLSLKAMTAGYHSVLCSQSAHLHHDECGAPEVIAQCKLVPLPEIDGKINLTDIKKAMIRLGDQHATQPRVISLTQPTELGAVYSVEEIKEICDFAHSKKMLIHIDGARLPNAVTALNTTFEKMITETGVDVVSFGGTKNGFLFGEAVVFLNTELAHDFKYIRKQGLNLPSKSRFIASQFLRFFKNDLWRDIASHSLEMAKNLAAALEEFPEVEITHPVESNVVFIKMPRDWIKPVRKEFFFYVWDENTFELRIMTSFDTTTNDIQGFCEELRKQNG